MSEQVMQSPEISDETMKRFRDFITVRATKPKKDAPIEGELVGKFDVDSTMWLIPVNSIEYGHFQYGNEEDAPDFQFAVLSPNNDVIMSMHTVESSGEIINIMNEGSEVNANDDLVNKTLDTIKRLEQDGLITPAQE